MFKRAERPPTSTPARKRSGQRKLKAGAVTRSIAGRVLHPGHLAKAIKLQRDRKANKRAYDDVHLALLAKLLPGGYLHYGYFDEVDRCPREISVADIERAQKRYAELLVDLAKDKSSPVLDVGCGMGTMSKLLLDRGFAPTALTARSRPGRAYLGDVPRHPVHSMQVRRLARRRRPRGPLRHRVHVRVAPVPQA
jgi:hypothetical protein